MSYLSTSSPSTAAVRALPARMVAQDILILIMVLSTFFSIVELPPVPVAPSVFMPCLLLLVRLPSIYHSPVWRCWPFRIFVLFTILQVIDGLFLIGFDYESVARHGRIVTAALFTLIISDYVARSSYRFARILALCVAATAVSLTWFLLEITFEEPFVTVRQTLYADIYALDAERMAIASRSGLCPYPHILGYQLSFFIPIVALASTFARTRLRQMLGALALALGLVVLFYSAQRSALLASALSLAAFLLSSQSEQNRRKGLLLSVLAVATIGLLLTADYWSNSDVETSLIHKIQDSAYWQEAFFRMQLQVRALELLYLHPFGLPRGGTDWESDGFWHVFYDSQYQGANQLIAVHNGYLLIPLNQGVLFLLIAAVFLISLATLIYTMLQSKALLRSYQGTMSLAVASATVGLFYCQSMTHNASVFSQDPTSLLAFALVVAADVLRRKPLA